MLIRAKIENFKSFDQVAELSMISSSKIRKPPHHLVRIGKLKLLKHAAIYGANAAGKSNIIEALRFVQDTLRSGLGFDSTNLYCRNAAENKGRPSSFELQFSVGSHFYAYGFSAVLSQRRVLEEWLYSLSATRAKPLFERRSEGEAKISTGLALEGNDLQRFEMYTEDFSENTSSLFLSELNRAKKYRAGSSLAVFKEAYDWLTSSLITFKPMQPFPNESYLFTDAGREETGRLLASFDTGIAELCAQQLSAEELQEVVPAPVLFDLLEKVQSLLNVDNPEKISATLRADKNLVVIEFSGDGSYSATAIRTRHAPGGTQFDFGEESDGTQRLFDLIFMLLAGQEDATYVVDELERSLHPMLVRRFLELFMERNMRSCSQLLFSTHEASIMDPGLFRRDEVWFVDRGRQGNSRLYSLDRFKERFDKDISKWYLEGRYGAVPVFGHYVLAEDGDGYAADS